jgi:hypothetical protein
MAKLWDGRNDKKAKELMFSKARIIFLHDLLVHVTNMTRTIEEMHNTNKEKCGLRFFRLELIYQTESIYAHRYQERLFVLPSPLHVACSVWCFSSYTEIGNAQLSPCWERASINVGKAIKVIFTCWLLLFLNIGIFGAICSIWYWVLGTRR